MNARILGFRRDFAQIESACHAIEFRTRDQHQPGAPPFSLREPDGWRTRLVDAKRMTPDS